MPYSPILQFAADYPWVAFFLSLPTALLLIAVAWCATTLITNAMNACVVVGNQIAATLMVLVRGYAPGVKESGGKWKGAQGLEQEGEDEDVGEQRGGR